jgi:hypothetical protein
MRKPHFRGREGRKDINRPWAVGVPVSFASNAVQAQAWVQYKFGSILLLPCSIQHEKCLFTKPRVLQRHRPRQRSMHTHTNIFYQDKNCPGTFCVKRTPEGGANRIEPILFFSEIIPTQPRCYRRVGYVNVKWLPHLRTAQHGSMRNDVIAAVTVQSNQQPPACLGV